MRPINTKTPRRQTSEHNFVRPLKSIFRSAFAQKMISFLIIGYIHFVYWTGSWTRVNEDVPNKLHEAGEPFILALWHGRLAMMGLAWRYGDSVTVLASAHRDGRIVARVLEGFGFSVVQGSTNKGGSNALRLLTKSLKNKGVVGITPDGPRGPRMRAAAGVVMLARLAKVPIIPMTFATSRRRVHSSWDRFVVPLPFARGVFMWGDAIPAPTSADKALMEETRLDLERALTALTAQADQLMGTESIPPEISL
jgi:lysophospholipid acyltransferase (LPLAT)-like uncharacterized protein